MAKNVLVLKHFESPREAGVYYRLICLTGGNKGEAYILLGNRIVIGRGEKADIRLNDTKSSREHAELTKLKDEWMITDLGSQNGIVINDRKVTQEKITENDKIIIGQTVFKFAKVEVASKNKVIKEESEEPEKKKSMTPLLALILIVGGFFLFEDDKKPVASGTKKMVTPTYQDVNTEYINKIKEREANDNKQVKEKLNIIYKRGLRELRERNYFRAIHEFNLALIVSPGDSQAEYYLRKTKEGLDREIEDFTARAQRDEESLKYQSAIVSYCSTIRLLYSVPSDSRHQNATRQILDLEKKLGLESGETDCIKKQRTSQ